MQPHPMLMSGGKRGTLCECLNYEKLTLEACKDLFSQQPPMLRTCCSSSKVRQPFSSEVHSIYNLSYRLIVMYCKRE